MPLTTDVFRRYKRGQICIETGYWEGAGVQAALDAGFAEVISIELDPAKAIAGSRRFIDYPNVSVISGDTLQRLPYLLETISEEVTFWLDAHPGDSSPVLGELAIIEKHPIKTHTLLIDDRRLMWHEWSNVQEQWVYDAIRRINAEYVISYADGFISNDIIVAQVPR